jgi:Tetratricopeptide repeat/Peptidase_C39 like family
MAAPRAGLRPTRLPRGAKSPGAALRTAAALALAAALGGCALPISSGPPQVRDGRLLQRPAGLPDQARVSGVPFYPDDTNACGPASLAEVLRFAGVDTDAERLKPQLITPALDGTLQYDMLGATRRAGRVAYVIRPSLGELFENVAQGRPVVVLQRLGIPGNIWHFAVVVGYDLGHDSVTLRSSTARALVLSVGQFDATWAGGGRWAFVALRPGEFPAQVQPLRYLQAVAPMEGVAPEAARRAYRDALARWPDSWVAMMGLGNLAYARKDYAQAAARFAQAASAHPDDGDPLNNLAQALLAAGDLQGARSAVERAVAIGKPNPRVYAKTREQILSAASSAH